jgi:hypothetical protein
VTVSQESIQNNPRFSNSTVFIGQEKIVMKIDTQFPDTDPWGIMKRDVITAHASKGGFDGRVILEGGIGAGGNVIACGKNIAGIIGVEIDKELISLAEYNLSNIRPNIPRAIINSDIVDYLSSFEGKFEGTAIFCLPQSKSDESDGLEGSINSITDTYSIVRDHGLEKFDKYGLNLNAAALQSLGQISTSQTDCFIILNGRIPENEIYKMFQHTGWIPQERIENIVQQDPDTDISWMREIQDEARFMDKDGYRIDFGDAYGRLLNAMNESLGNVEEARKILRAHGDVRHKLMVYRLSPFTGEEEITFPS